MFKNVPKSNKHVDRKAIYVDGKANKYGEGDFPAARNQSELAGGVLSFIGLASRSTVPAVVLCRPPNKSICTELNVETVTAN
jgi:hypothetical protein